MGEEKKEKRKKRPHVRGMGGKRRRRDVTDKRAN